MYSREEIREILRGVSQEENEVKFEKFETLGIHTVFKASNIIYNCNVCKKSLLSNHLLDLHVAENHDSFFYIQSSKKPSFQCFLEACQHMSNNAEERKNHCISDHKFPHDFPFEVCKVKKVEEEEKRISPVMKHKNFQFGHKSQKVFKASPKTKIDMKDLMDVLPV